MLFGMLKALDLNDKIMLYYGVTNSTYLMLRDAIKFEHYNPNYITLSANEE